MSPVKIEKEMLLSSKKFGMLANELKARSGGASQ
jgi:hypothetical protein